MDVAHRTGSERSFPMKLLSYYVQILFPIPLMAWYYTINPYLFLSSLVLYVLVYRTVFDYFRLRELGIFSKRSDSMKLLIPFYRLRVFHALYLRVN